MKHPEWKKEDAQFINELIEDMKYFQEMSEKYMFSEKLRIQFNVTVTNLKDLIIRLKREYQEAYG